MKANYQNWDALRAQLQLPVIIGVLKYVSKLNPNFPNPNPQPEVPDLGGAMSPWLRSSGVDVPGMSELIAEAMYRIFGKVPYCGLDNWGA